MSNVMRSLVLQLTADNSQYLRTLRQSQDEARRTGQQSGSGFVESYGRAIADGSGRIRSAFNDVLQGVGVGVGASLANTFINEFGSKISEGFAKGVDFEQTEIAFKVFTGSAKKAKETLNSLVDFAASTPFELPQVMAAGRQLLAFGVDAKNLEPTLRKVGDVAAGVNAPIADLASLFGRAKTQGRLFSEDIYMLTGRGIPIIAELAKQFGVTESSVMELVSKGKVGFGNLETAFSSLSGAGGKFFNLMQEQSVTVGGKLSNLSDQFTKLEIAAFNAFKPITGAIVDILAGMLAPLNESEDIFGKVQASAQEIADYLKEHKDVSEAIGRELKDGMEAALMGVTNLAKQTLDYLKENPGAIKQAIHNMGLLVEATKPFLWIIEKSIEGWTKIGGLVKVIGESMPDETRTRPDVSQRLEYERRKDSPGGQRLQQEIAKYGGSDSDAAVIMEQARRTLPFWKTEFSTEEWDKVVREQAKKFFEQNPVKAIAGSSDPNKRVYPIQGGQYVGGGGSFGAGRSYGPHDGEDITGSPGTVVKAVMAGTVESIKTLDAAAKSFSITVKAIDGTTQYYKHVTPKVAQGQRFESGQAIATVSQQDSLSSGPHLHYGVYRGDQKIDPKSYLKGAIAPNDYRPPAGMTSAKAPGSVATGKSQVTMTDTGKVNAQGQKIFKVDVLDASGNVVFTSAAFSGRPENQKLETAAQGVPGSKNPIPEGRYKLGGYETGDFGKVGDRWIGLQPLSGGRRGDDKSPFGFHADVDKILGSEGCIVFTDPATVKRLADKAVQVGAKEFIVNYGLGTVSTPPGKAATASAGALSTSSVKQPSEKERLEAFLALIGHTEGADYNTLYGGKKFTDMSGHPGGGPAGRYQMKQATFQEIQSRLGLKDFGPESQDKAAIELLREKGALPSVFKGDWKTAIAKLTPYTWSSLPGGAEPRATMPQATAFLSKQLEGKTGGGYASDLERQRMEDVSQQQRKLLEESRRRQSDQRRQRQEQELRRIDDQREIALTQFDVQSAGLPASQQESRGSLRKLLELKFGRDRQLKEIDQATGPDGNLRAELKNRLADQKAGITPQDGRQIGEEIKFLEARKKVIEQNYQLQKQLVSVQSEAKFKEQFDGLAKSAVDAEEQIKALKRTYADQTPEQRLDNAIASTVAGFDSQKSSIVNNIKSTSELIENKKLLGLETSKEAELLERLKAAYLGMLGVQDQAIAKTKEETDALEKQRALREQAAIYGMDVAILNGRANARESNGDAFGASALRERADLLQEAIRFTNELAQISIEFEGRPTIIAQLTKDANELSQINIEAIQDKYKTFGETVGAEIGNAFNGLISDLKNTSNPLELLLNLLNRLADSLLQIGLNALNLPKLLGGLFGGKKGGGGDVLSLIGGLFGGAGGAAGNAVFGAGDAGLGSLLSFVGPFKDGGRIPNYAGGGSVGLMDAISQAAQREGPGATLIMAHANEHVLSDLAGEAQRYRSLESRLGANPLSRIGNFASGGMVAPTGLSGLNLTMPTMSNSSALSVSMPVNFSLTTSDPSVNEERINKFTAKMREEMTQVAAGMFMAEFDQRGALR